MAKNWRNNSTGFCRDARGNRNYRISLLCAVVRRGLVLEAIEQRGDRSGLATCGDRVAATARAGVLNNSSFAHADDVALCSQTDRFSFAMRAETIGALVRVRAV